MRLRKGTSIIEAAVAIALMGIILLWSITAYTNISKQSKTSEDIEIVSTLASQQIESLKALQYTGNTTTGIQGVATSLSVVPFNSPYDKYGYKYVVPPTVTYNDQNGNPVTVPNPQDGTNVYLKALTAQIYKMTDETTPMIQMDCNFLRNKSGGKNVGL
jgi:type II secretory pathway pseudopilin PulG